MDTLSESAASDGRLLDPMTSMGAVSLRVADLEGMSDYYTRAFGFEPIEEHRGAASVRRVLGRQGVPLVRMVHTPDLPVAHSTEAGLYHTAFLFGSQSDLASAVYRAARTPNTRFTGSADHLVSEAFYFVDPEGNGIELYRDRPRSQWQYDHGEVVMATDYLDVNHYVMTHLDQQDPERGLLGAAAVGHVHLQVGDIAQSSDFYIDVLGFEVTRSRRPGALFASAGGYHHHVAFNVWHSRGAGPRAATLGLGELAVAVPSRIELDQLMDRLRIAGVPYRDRGASVEFADPWGIDISVSCGEGVEELLGRGLPI